ncbi:hypothetical protein K227x_52820 [Rubripirellula lacrimiformis]|uniref:LarA-like N-terminal domain-containing protein n=1 Tax=Rubripirellula lacrimiformis TaxID=1930273 RepID=A0A517NIA4_9BACT|nr:lactate racemase domain-containing protein [Rubripirellula lacrimiformis]QDT06861.1 hypothetical protein K227x_52820 [Rubripirellula lacrimiformis]
MTTTLDRSPIAFPKMFRVRQRFDSHAIPDIQFAVSNEMRRVGLGGIIHPGQRVALAVGSRGITNLTGIVAAVADSVRQTGATPIVVPAMGSHGGATADGQSNVLASLGVTESTVGAPIVSSMETVVVGQSHGIDIHFDQAASQCDHVIVINRIKPHTRLTGRYESGLIKMLMIGLGKHRGAAIYHQVFSEHHYRLDSLADDIVGVVRHAMPITMGIAVVEDAFEHTSIIEAVPAACFLDREPELLAIARSRMPKLPFDHAELLIVDQVGKEISGTGMDTNVIGRKFNDKVAAADEFPKIKQIHVRSLSSKTAGNAAGIGIAEYCHRRVVNAMDHHATRINCVTSEHVTAGAIPLTFDSDREVFQAVLSQNGRIPVARMKWMRIADTLRLEMIDCSEGFWDAAQQDANLEILTQPKPIRLNAGDDLENLK